MIIKTIKDLELLIFECHKGKKYNDALNLINQNLVHFPEEQKVMNYWLMCFHSLLGNETEVIEIFGNSLKNGLFFNMIYKLN
jgi:hypothetical protein